MATPGNSEARGFLGAEVRETDRKRIRGVIIRCFGQTEKRADHERDLILSRAAAPDSRLFDSRRRIFEDR